MLKKLKKINENFEINYLDFVKLLYQINFTTKNYYELIQNKDKNRDLIEKTIKMNEILEKNKTTSKQLQLDYQEYIKKANVEREKYIKLSENLYDKVQRLDEEFIKAKKRTNKRRRK